MADGILVHTFGNSLTLIAEQMPHVRSAAFSFLAHAGCAYDPSDRLGQASVLAEMIVRGAGSRDSERLALALDNLGVDRGESVGLLTMWFHGSTLAANLSASLELYADILRRPMLPESDLEAARELVLADLQALDDSPQEQVMIELRRRYLPEPLNRDRCGTAEGLQAVEHAHIVEHARQVIRPNGGILSVAGCIDWPRLVADVERLFGDWPQQRAAPIAPKPDAPVSAHLEKDTQQTQIALAFPSVMLSHPMYYAARGAIAVLSGGMSSRLFTEVREKRGLCYSVFAQHETLNDRGCVMAYSGTRSERAQETLDVMLEEMARLREGVSSDELERVRAGLKTSLIMQQESTSARAGAIARDWFFLNRVRGYDELQQAIDGLSANAIIDYVDAFPLTRPTVVTLGPAALSIPE